MLISKKGLIFVPKMKSYKIKDIVSRISSKQKIIGIRSGEKIEETLLSDQERKKAIERRNMWIIESFDS